MSADEIEATVAAMMTKTPPSKRDPLAWLDGDVLGVLPLWRENWRER